MHELSLSDALCSSIAKYKELAAIRAGGVEISYATIGDGIDALRATLSQSPFDEARPQRIAILTNRDVETYAAIYGLIALGHSYVPLNPAWPVERLSMILDRADVDAVIYSAGPRISGLVGSLQERHRLPFVKLAHEGGVFRVDCEGVRSEPRNMATDIPGLAYIMFTSGSTGVPKGVPITRANVEAYVAAIIGQYPFEAGDRVVQTVEMTFDLSVHDMMLSWVQGCCLLSVPANASQLAPRLIAQQGGTHWLTVPSAAAQAKILGLLKPGAMPSMKTLMFCGEALPQSLALACAEAAPNAKLVNIYGPTEATIAISAYDWTEARTRELDVVPLGEAIGEQQISLSAEGEIMLSGTQLSSGYLNDPEKTQDRFCIIEGRRWYLTGDLGAYDPDHGFIFRGRMDSQIKLRGYRIELGDVEVALRQVADTDLVAAIATDSDAPSSYRKLAAFIAGSPLSMEEVGEAVAKKLPPYMVPDRLIAIADVPLNANGKVDYVSLRKRLEEAS